MTRNEVKVLGWVSLIQLLGFHYRGRSTLFFKVDFVLNLLIIKSQTLGRQEAGNVE